MHAYTCICVYSLCVYVFQHVCCVYVCVHVGVEFLLELVNQRLLVVTTGQLVMYMQLAKAGYAVLENFWT